MVIIINIMNIKLTSVFVDDQDKALRFYTEKMGFVEKTDLPVGEARWLIVASYEGQDGTELMLESDYNPAARAHHQAIFQQGIPFAALAVNDLEKEYERLKNLGVVFTREPVKSERPVAAVLDDTCGNLIQLFQV